MPSASILLCGALLGEAFLGSSLCQAQTAGAKHGNVGTGLNFYSLEKEIALGRQLALEVEKQVHLSSDPILTEYVSRLGRNLARHSDVRLPVTVKVIESDQANAFTLPGGRIFIDTGLIRLSETEAELAAALAHEIAHAAARHATRQATTNRIVQGATIPLIFLGPLPGLGAKLGASLGCMKFARTYETEADELGLRYLSDSGYDPTAAIDMFERMEARERMRSKALGKLFSTHPATADRIAKTQKLLRNTLWAREEYVVNTSEYEEIRKRLPPGGKPAEPRRPTLFRAGETSSARGA